MLPQKHFSYFLSKTDISDTVKLFSFSKPKEFSYLPGQYISIEVAPKTRRSYSMCSIESESTIDLLVDISPMGVGTKYLLGLKENDEISYIGPLGYLVLPESIENINLNLVCTGTGVCPYISFLKHLKQIEYKGKVKLLYSEKYLKDFVTIKSYPKNFELKQTVTREKSVDIIEGRLTNHLNFLSPDQSIYYICGNFKMIKEVISILIANNVSKDRIIIESFY